MYIIRVVEGSMSGETFRVLGRTVIGRSADTEIQLVDKGISRQHCCILEDDHGVPIVVDLGSANGTLVDGDKVDRAELRPGSKLTIGAVTMVFDEAEDDDEDDEVTLMSVKLASGPAEADTAVTDPIGCSDPLHVEALKLGWKFCPACGKTA